MADDIRIDEASGATGASDRLRITAGDRLLAEYVFRPTHPTFESPRPYLSPVHTLGGELVSLYRPHDHVWHKGIAWSLPVVGDENFWGGPTFVRGEGYVQLANNGRQQHVAFGPASRPEDGDGGSVAIVETLDWITQSGEHLFAEQRTLTASIVADDTWVLGFGTRMRNVSGRAIPIGSPTTRGRENAGYGGLFWRGPRSFTGGLVLARGRTGGDELRGQRAPWLGFTGRHDGSGAHSTIVMVDDPANVQHPPQWFARTEEFACLCPAPFFSEEHVVAPDGELRERVAVVIADGASDPDRAAVLAQLGRLGLAALVAAPGADDTAAAVTGAAVPGAPMGAAPTRAPGTAPREDHRP
ncbi:PmoA family protein [Agromyces sp. MMS24-JH15]|uniref:DUF6807 domain-containing protein n=1 Tax=Agromyces sp. MMS24-JH15 TaxID=3243765 RepID=UPI00374A2AEE